MILINGGPGHCASMVVDREGRPRRKRSEGKATWPGCKQVYRRSGAHGRAELARLPGSLRAPEDADPYPVETAPALRALADKIDAYT